MTDSGSTSHNVVCSTCPQGMDYMPHEGSKSEEPEVGVFNQKMKAINIIIRYTVTSLINIHDILSLLSLFFSLNRYHFSV